MLTYRCNYFRFTEDFIYDELRTEDNQNVADEETMWYQELGALSPRRDEDAEALVEVCACLYACVRV